MSTLEQVQYRKTHASGLFTALRDSGYIKALPSDYIGPRGLTKRDILEKIGRLGSCCSNIDIIEIEGGQDKLYRADFCKQHIVCGNCANRSQAIRREHFTPAIKDMARRAAPGYRGDDRVYGYFVTFTIPDGKKVYNTYARLKSSMMKFRKMGQHRPLYKNGQKIAYRVGYGEWSKMSAACGTIETIEGRAGDIHSHNHMILFTSRPLDYRVYDPAKRAALNAKYGKYNIPEIELKAIEINGGLSKITKEWQAADGDAINFDVQPLRKIPKTENQELIEKCAKMNFADSIAYQAREVLKYAAKVDSNNSNFSSQLIDEMHNTRCFESYGLFRGIVDNEEYDDNQAAAGDNVTGIYRYTWDHEKKQYLNKQSISDPGIDAGGHIGKYGLYKYIQNQIIGEYRNDRREMLAAEKGAAALDALRDNARQRIKNLWSGFNVNRNTAEYSRAIGFEAERPAPWIPYEVYKMMGIDKLQIAALKDIYRNYLNKKLYACTTPKDQKAQDVSEW